MNRVNSSRIANRGEEKEAGRCSVTAVYTRHNRKFGEKESHPFNIIGERKGVGESMGGKSGR